jgi:predicted cupin superfamily sugar epimerase
MSTHAHGHRAAELIAQLGLQPHPEGGAYVEVHRSVRAVQPDDGRPARAALTSIYFLLTQGGASRWHQVASDEVWCHLEGAPLLLYQLDEKSQRLERIRLGPVAAEQRPQHTVPAGQWQAATYEGEYSLVACMVAPGFEFADFKLIEPDSALAQAWLAAHPALAHLV